MSSFNLNLTTSDTTAFNIDFSNLHDVDYVTACFDSLHNSTRGNPSRTSRLQTLSTFDSTFDTTNATANNTLNHRNSYHSTNTISTTTILSHSNNNLLLNPNDLENLMENLVDRIRDHRNAPTNVDKQIYVVDHVNSSNSDRNTLDAATDDKLRQRQVHQRKGIQQNTSKSSTNSKDKTKDTLPISVQVGIKLFFRLLQIAKLDQNPKTLSKVVARLPIVLASMPPLALADSINEDITTTTTAGIHRGNNSFNQSIINATPSSRHHSLMPNITATADETKNNDAGETKDTISNKNNTNTIHSNNTDSSSNGIPSAPMAAAPVPPPAPTARNIVDALSTALENAITSSNNNGGSGSTNNAIHHSSLSPLAASKKTMPVSQTDSLAALSSLVGLAVKQGSLTRILRSLILIMSSNEKNEKNNIVDNSLSVLPYLKELSNTEPLTIDKPVRLRKSVGILMTFGKGDHGKLGHGNSTENKRTPTFVSSLRNIPLVRIDSLSTHSVAISTDGVLYTWGNGDKHRLGHGTTAKEYVPRPVHALRDKPPVISVACGLGHTLALVSTGNVYAWGNGSNGRLGVGDTQDRSRACLLTTLENHVITEVFSGASHSLCVDEMGVTYSWG